MSFTFCFRKSYFVADERFRLRKTKTASNQVLPGIENTCLYQFYPFFKKTDKITATLKTYYVADTDFRLRMTKAASNQVLSSCEITCFCQFFCFSKKLTKSPGRKIICRGRTFSPAVGLHRVKSGPANLSNNHILSRTNVFACERQKPRQIWFFPTGTCLTGSTARGPGPRLPAARTSGSCSGRPARPRPSPDCRARPS